MIKKFNENFKEPEEMVVRVKDIIKYLEDNFDLEAKVHLDHDGWNIYPHGVPIDVQELIYKRGIFTNFR